MVYARHRRRSKRPIIHSNKLEAFVAAQELRLTEAAVKASCVLTASALAAAETVTIGSKVYTFQDSLTNVDGNVKRSGTLATDLATLVKAINLTGVAGTDYAVLMTIHPTAEATGSTATTLTARAKTGGTAGNSIATTETSGTAAWATPTMLGGLASSAFNALRSLRKNTAAEIKAATDKDNLAS